jgi:alkylation response protein AidB-like acyl-CoA dehydrogenase
MTPSLVDLIRSESSAAEALGMLTPVQLELMREQGWLRLLIPRSIGGLEYDLPDLLELQEAASRADGSFGWVLALCGGAGFFAGFVDRSVALELFGSPDVCVAGTGFPAGVAVSVPGGYRVSGHWRYASGAPHATLYTANCHFPDGVRAVIFLPSQITLSNGWQPLGLRATASQDMIVRDAFVPFERTFSLDKPFVDGPLYHYPFHQQAEAVLSVTLLGMAAHFLELFEERILGRFPRAEPVLSESRAAIAAVRTSYYDAIRASWMQPSNEALLTAVGDVARTATRTALHCADRLYPYGGMEMMQMHTEINRVWRDIHTASQHTLLAPM